MNFSRRRRPLNTSANPSSSFTAVWAWNRGLPKSSRPPTDGTPHGQCVPGVTPIALTDEEDIKEHGAYDPHIWLSLVNAQIEVSNIAAALAEADPANADYYRNNAGNYKKQLQARKMNMPANSPSIPRKDFVTGHAAFAYLCRDFGLTQHSVESVFSSGESIAAKWLAWPTIAGPTTCWNDFVEDMVSQMLKPWPVKSAPVSKRSTPSKRAKTTNPTWN